MKKLQSFYFSTLSLSLSMLFLHYCTNFIFLSEKCLWLFSQNYTIIILKSQPFQSVLLWFKYMIILRSQVRAVWGKSCKTLNISPCEGVHYHDGEEHLQTKLVRQLKITDFSSFSKSILCQALFTISVSDVGISYCYHILFTLSCTILHCL